MDTTGTRTSKGLEVFRPNRRSMQNATAPPRIIAAAAEIIVRLVGHQHVGRVRRPEEDRAGPPETIHQRCIPLGNVALPKARTAFRTQAAHVDAGLHRQGDAVQPARRPAVRQRLVGRASLVESAFGVEMHDGVQPGVPVRDARGTARRRCSPPPRPHPSARAARRDRRARSRCCRDSSPPARRSHGWSSIACAD